MSVKAQISKRSGCTHLTVNDGWRVRLMVLDRGCCVHLKIMDGDGNQVGEMEILPPPAAAPTQDKTEVDRRAGICGGCEFNRGVRREVHGQTVDTVKCDLCGCGGLSLRRGDCPRGLWGPMKEGDAAR